MAVFIRFASVLIATSMWAVVGAYIWIPAVLVTSGLYAAGVLAAALWEKPSLLQVAESTLQSAIEMYADGFKRIWDVAAKPSIGDAHSDSQRSTHDDESTANVDDLLQTDPQSSTHDDKWTDNLGELVLAGVGSIVAATVVWAAIYGIVSLLLRIFGDSKPN